MVSTNWTRGSTNSTNWASSSTPSTNWESDDPSAGFVLLQNGDNILTEISHNLALE